METPKRESSSLIEALYVGGASLVMLAAVFSTYTRFPADHFYHVSGTGLSGGASRALVFLNFPLAFVAVALLPIILSRLIPGLNRPVRLHACILGAISTALCLVATISVRQSNLDARWINVIPAIGVAFILILFVITIRREGIGAARPWRRFDTATFISGLVLVLLGLPWILANLGIYAEDVPGLSWLFMSIDKNTDGVTEVIVHLGDHHGFDGMFLAVVALTLIRVVGTLHARWMNRALSWYLAFMLVYGLANMRQDFWGEQVVERGWSEKSLTNMMIPALDQHWGIFALLVIAVWAALFFRPHHRDRHIANRVTVPT